MKHKSTRREFIKAAGVTIAAAGVAPSLFAADRPSRWPIGCRDSHLKSAGVANPWQAMKILGAECIDVVVNKDMSCPNLSGEKACNLGSEEAIQALKTDLRASGCQITAFSMSNRLDEGLEEDLAWTDKVVKAAASLGVKTIRIDVVPRKIAEADFLPFATSACKRMCDLANGTPVRFGVENHSTTTNNPVFLRSLLDGVASKKLGVTLDIANFYWWGHPEKSLYGLYEEFAPRTFHTHIKNIHYPEEMRNAKRPRGWEYAKYAAPIYEGDIDMKRVVAILRKSGYDGDLCVEDESIGKKPVQTQAEILKREMEYLKGLV